MQPLVHLVVPNLADFNIRQFEGRLDVLAERRFHTIGRAYADQAVLWCAGPRIIVLPPGVESAWLDDVCRVLGEQPPDVVSPPIRTGRPMVDLLTSDQALAELLDLLGTPRPVELMCFGATPEIYALAAIVRAAGHRLELDVPPPDRYWVTSYLDSKLSCSDVAAWPAPFRTPRGWTVSSRAELRGVVDLVLDRGHGAVVKGRFGVGGSGCLMVDAENPGDLWAELAGNPFFRDFPVLVQEHVRVAEPGDMSGVDMHLTPEGVDTVVTSIERRDGIQCAALAGADLLLPAGIAEAVDRAAEYLATHTRRIGYRGWFGADLLPGADGDLYLIEINARRTGGMHAVGLLKRRGGAEAVSASRDRVVVRRPGPLAYDDVRQVFLERWDRGRTVYPSTVRGLPRQAPLMGVVAVAGDVGSVCHLLDATVSAINHPEQAPA